MSEEVLTGESMATRSAFMRLVTTRPDPSSLAHALGRGPLAIYKAFTSTIYAADAAEEHLELLGLWGFGFAASPYSRLPLDLDFPLTRAYLTGQTIFVAGASVERDYPLMGAARDAVLREVRMDSDGVTIVAMPLQYQGISIGACSWWCLHDRPWTWNDYTYVDGVAATLSMWLQLRRYEHSLDAAGLGSTRLETRPRLLTERQKAVLTLIRDGKSNAAIAASLGYSISTVKNDVQALFTVLGATRRKELVRKALDAGLLTEASAAAP